MAALSGYKTYIVAAVTIVYALTEWLAAGTLDQNGAIAMIFAALGGSALRHGIAAS